MKARYLPLTAPLLVLALLVSAPAAASEGVVTAPEALAASKAGKSVLIDVRSPAEWRQTGIPKGARAITIHQRGGISAFVAKVRAALKDRKDTPIMLICAAGGRSSRARAALMTAGFTNVKDVSEGMMGRGGSPGWLRRNLPTEPWRPAN